MEHSPRFFQEIDSSVVRRCQAGEMDGFKELYLFYGQAIRHLALSMLGDLDEANDLLQDVFLKVYDKIGQYRFKAPFAAWFYRITVNLCQDRLRRRSRRQKQFEVIQQFHVGDQSSGPLSGEKELLLREKERLVRRALMQVHPRYRVCLILRDIEGCSYEEIASVLEISVGTVRSRLGRGRYQLRQLLLSQE